MKVHIKLAKDKVQFTPAGFRLADFDAYLDQGIAWVKGPPSERCKGGWYGLHLNSGAIITPASGQPPRAVIEEASEAKPAAKAKSEAKVAQ